MLSLIPCLTGTTEKAGSSIITITWEEKDAPPFFLAGEGQGGRWKEKKEAENFTIHKMEINVGLRGAVRYSGQSMGCIMR